MSATAHSINREKGRRNVKSLHTAKKDIARARERGTCAEGFSSWERSYLNNESRGDCIAVAYNNFCYIFNADGYCVTLYHLPAWFGKKKRFDGKLRIRNYKKYCQINVFFDIAQELDEYDTKGE